MSKKTFKCLLVSAVENEQYKSEITDLDFNHLPEGEVLINVKYSSLNYKDALSSVGNKGVTKYYPHIPGIDAAGIVESSSNDEFKSGDKVIVNGYDLGMSTWGGFSEYIRVPAEWVIKLPETLTMKESMIYGTAGFTSALSIYKILHSGITPEDGEILVTGATGGVGSIAVSILKKLGFDVIAATGKLEQRDMLIAIGAKDIIHRSELNDTSGRPLLSGRWASVVDTVGGNMLATAIKTTKYGGSVTCCGNVASHEFDTSVYPFILRGVTLYGIDAVQCPKELRQSIWDNLASDWKLDNLSRHISEISLEEVSDKIDLMLQGKLKGRTIINMDL